MPDFKSARKNMVDGQIHPNGVMREDILDVFGETPREIFVDRARVAGVYNDEDVYISDAKDRFLLDPTTHARIVQALEPQAEDIVLDVACGTGYSSCILSPLVSTVVSLETSQDYLDKMALNASKLDACNIAAFCGDLADAADNAPYDLIFMNGAVSSIPEKLVAQLAPMGRMSVILKEEEQKLAQVLILDKTAAGHVSSRSIFSSGTPYLKGFEPMPAFVF